MIDVIKSHYKNIGKFGVVGILNTALDFLVYYILNHFFGFYFIFAHVCSFFVAATNSFFLNALWTFKNLKRDQIFKQIFRFILIAVVGLGISTVAITVAEQVVENIYIAKVFATGATFLWNYTGSFLFVFRRKNTE